MATPVLRRKLHTMTSKAVGTGMDFSEITERFVRSRQAGTGGARVENRTESVGNYTYDLKTFFSYMTTECKVVRYEDIRLPHVERYVAFTQKRMSSRGKPLSKSSKNHVWRTLKAFFRWVDQDSECRAMRLIGWTKGIAAGADEMGFKSALPAISANEQRVYIPSQEEIGELLTVMEARADKNEFEGIRDLAMTSMMLDGGYRVGELCHMTPDHIKWDIRQVLVPNEGKTGERYVPIDVDTVGPLIRRYMKVREAMLDKLRKQMGEEEWKNWLEKEDEEGNKLAGAHYLFMTIYAGRCRTNQMVKVYARYRMRNDIGISDIGNLTAHALRHYFCTMYLVHGGNLQNLQQITGHESIETLMKYLHFAQKMTVVSAEHGRVSPLKNLKRGSEGMKKKRSMR